MASEDEGDDLQDLKEDYDETMTGASRECFKVLSSIKETQEEDVHQETLDWSVAKAYPQACEHSSGKVPLDREDMRELVATDDCGCHSESGTQQPLGGTKNAKTLAQLIEKMGGQAIERWFGHLWRLLLNLRAGAVGCDGSIIRSHRTCRAKSGKMNWHQQAEHACKLLNAARGITATRTSRVAAWKALTQSTVNKILHLKDHELPPVISSGMVVLVLAPLHPPAWRVGLILTQWTACGKKAKLTHLPVPNERLHSVRVALMYPADGQPEGMFEASQKSVAVVCTSFRIALVLKDVKVERSPDGFLCQLNEGSLHAVQNAHLIKAWPKSLLQSVTEGVQPCKTSTTQQSTPKKRKRRCDAEQEDGAEKEEGEKKSGKKPGAQPKMPKPSPSAPKFGRSDVIRRQYLSVERH